MNARYYHNDRSIRWALAVSLLFHFGFIVYVGITNIHQPTPSQQIPSIPDEIILPKQENEWVETKTRSSGGGAPIFFKDDYQSTITHHTPSDDTPEKTETAQKEKTTEPGATEEIIAEPHVVEKNLEIEKTTIVQTKKSHPTQPFIAPPQIKPSTINNQPRQHQSKSPQKNLPSLAQLTQGMLNYMQEGGKHSVSMLGKKHGVPTDEQLKYERYLERLNQCLHNSFVINSHKQPVHPTDAIAATVFLALNEDGSIYNLKLVKSCGNRLLDLFVLSVLRDASSSFPPVPHYLPHNPFTIHYIINMGGY